CRVDESNLRYFNALYSKYLKSHKSEKLVIGENAFPTTIAPDSLMKELPYVDYEELLKQKDELSSYARKIRLWLKKMQGGTGSSMTRTTYLAKIKNIKPEEVKIGSKGTDLFINVDGKMLPLAEVQVMQGIIDAKEGTYSKVIFHDVVSDETKGAVTHMWKKMKDMLPDNCMRFKDIVQAYQPTVDENDDLSTNRLNPGGHGFIAVDALTLIRSKHHYPENMYENLVCVIGNGEDLGSTPDAVMLGWVLKNKVPITMLTTEKTEIDLKGGQIALLKKDDGVCVTIIEKAQAEQAEQLELFEQMGLRKGDKKAFFNTNVAVLNYDVLTPLLEKLVDEIGEEKFLEIITPDLIVNAKKQKDKDGVTRVYKQLEGAMGSSLLNLDKFWREKYKKPLVHFINIDRSNRTRFFCPVKTPFDLFLQFFSDRFTLNTKTMRLVDNRPGKLPVVILKDDYYNDVENTLNAFKGCKVLNLDKLYIEGIANLQNKVLSGDVEIKKPA
ncbi:MAG: UTP--glucose-1-phosphate uridylyltransferase, partial [Pseudomonadota bacterium]